MRHGYNAKCRTVEQFRILSWLRKNGVPPCYVKYVEMLSGNRVKVVNPCGGYMIVICDGKGEDSIYIDQTPE